MVAWIALVLSIVSAIAAAASAWYARSQARHAGEAVKIERLRRHRELTPTITGAYLEASAEHGDSRAAVRLTNRSELDLDRVDVSVVPPHKLYEKIIEGIYDPQTREAMPNTETGPLPREASWEFDIVHHATDDGPWGGTVNFRCRCHASGHEPWDVVVPVKFPDQPMVAWASFGR